MTALSLASATDIPVARAALDRHAVGRRTARRLRSTEHKIDAALAEALLLGHQMVVGRAQAGFSAAVGDEALTALLQGLDRLGQARTALVGTHALLLAVADDQDVRWRMDGPTESKPRPTGGIKALRAVA